MKHLYLILICVLLVSCKQGREEPKQEPDETSCPCCKVLTQDESTCGGELAWDYPVKPGTEEWKELNSHQQIIDTCQIPEEILSSLSTKDLTKICLQYPLISGVLAYNCMDHGLDILFDEFNGIRELFNREDVFKELLKRYRCAIQRLSVLDSVDLANSNVCVDIAILECLLSRYHSENNDAQDNYKEILLHLLCGYEKELMYPEYFGISSFYANYFARVHVIINICPQCFDGWYRKDGKPYLCGNYFSDESVDKINELSYQLIEKQ